MILPWMVYTAGVALLVGCAAACAESAFRQRGWPLRGVWAGAMLVSTAVPAGALLRVLLAPETSAAAPAGALPAAEWVYPLLVVSAGGAPGALDLDPLLLAGWAATSVALMGWLALAVVGLGRRRSGWERRSVDGRPVWVSVDTGPAVFGLVRGRIVIPAWVLEMAAEDRRMILAHEEEHIEARDPPLLAGSLLLLLAFPWNLPLWWQWRRLRQAAEVDCDRRVLGGGPDPRAYGRLLVEVNQRGTRQRLAIAALTESPSFLERRIRTMITPRNPRWRLVAAFSLAISAAALVAACAIDHPAGLGGTPGSRTGDAAAAAATTYDAADLDQRPEVTNRTAIPGIMNRFYPAALGGTEGLTVMRFVITPEGTVDPASVTVVSTTHEEFGVASKQVVERITFNPGRLGGEAVRARVEIPLRWEPAL